MDENTRIELEYIKAAIDDIKANLKLLVDRGNLGDNRMNSMERDYALFCQSCEGTKAANGKEIQLLTKRIEILENRGKEKQQSWQFWAYMVTALVGWAAFLLKVFGVIK